ncbi:LysR family transcriptional regulator [Elioraea sp.]|uniref:LysR family transcriptional regulator n=1 Tax=Elioraea sp. TaxID=2185103 RepID=UPI00307F484F
MKLNLRELEVFQAVMQTGSVTAAALELGITQPAASKMLQQAEQRLGFALFRRDRRQLVPTPEAHALLPELLGTLASIDGLERLAEALRAGQSGQLCIAAVPVLATALLPPAVEVFRARHQDVSVRLRAMSALEVVNHVADHRADLGVILGDTGDRRVEARPFRSSAIGCALRRDHRLASRRHLTLGDLAGIAVISLGAQQPVGQALLAAQARAGVQWRLAVEVSQSSIACALVRAGAGVAVLDGFGLAEARAQGLVTRPLVPRLLLEATLVVPHGRVPTRLASAFCATLERLDAVADPCGPGGGRPRRRGRGA